MAYPGDEEDPWGSFADAGSTPTPRAESDPWSAFPDAPRKGGKRVPAPRKRKPEVTVLPDEAVVTEAVDGDTLDAAGNRVRLWGVDAPELKQQGYDRQGQPVQIGQQSKQALSDIAINRNLIFAPRVGESYGRPVVPATVDGTDVGQTLARDGNALAAPEYLDSDPDRRFRYMQAERLARQNGLGIHDTYHQKPSDFRREPAAPDSETVAQFWDTPTPYAGMRPEDEAKWLSILQTATTADEIVSLARTVGGTTSPEVAAKWIKWRDEERAKGRDPQAPMLYGKAPPILTDQGDGKAGASARGLANGVLPNFLEETGAVVDTLGGTSGRENVWNSDRRLADIWANNEAQNEAITGHDRFAHPWVTGGSEIAGGVILPMGKVKSAADLAKWGAGYGFASGFGREGSIPERLTSGVVGAGEGLITTVVGGKALDAAAPYVGRLFGRKGNDGAQGAVDAAESVRNVPPPRTPDRIDVGSSAPPAPAPNPPRLPTGYVPKPGQRAPDWIDINGPPPTYDQLIANGASPAQAAIHLALNDPRRSSMAMANDNGASITSELPRQRDYLFPMEAPRPISQPMSNAQTQALASQVQPRDVLPIPSNQVGSAEELAAAQAGRFEPAKPVDEATTLESRTVMAQNGRDLPKRGPLDLVTWLRTQGGLKDQGGNLRAMGIDNAPRDLDFARGEQRFGKLVNPDGMNLDDAAFKAWEAGYIQGGDRPDINQFLDAIDRTHSGAERYFHPNDLDEVARFEGTRADRQQLEEQLANGPVHVDRSVPATEPQPFPPISAYEEWGPNGGPDLVGNIRVDKLDTPQDIARALDFTHRQVGGFDPATRGRVSYAETERLAGELGMTPETLLSRRRGQAFNAEEALAARQILAKSGNELVNMAKRLGGLDNPGDELLADFRKAWVRHAAIQEQVSGMTAEAGRALGQFKMAADSRAVRGDVLASLVRGGGGKENLQEAAKRLVEMAETEPGKFNAFAEKALKPRWQNKVSELFVNFLLSFPQTHAVNITSNTLTSLGQIPEHAVAAVIGKARQALPGASAERITGTELGQRTFGLVQGAKEGAVMFARALKTGEASDFVSKVEGQEYNAISGWKGKAIRFPTRLLTAEDEFFKGIARRMELNGLAARQAFREGLKGDAAKARIAELTSNPPDDLLHASEQYGRYLTFQAKLGPAAQDVSNFANRHLPFKFVLTFVRTPTNLLKFATERSPLAPMLKEWREDFMAGGARRDVAVAKALVGSGFGAVIYQAAQDGMITGAAPADPKKARLLYADGWKPYSIKVGDTYYSYRRLDPFSSTIGVAADMATLPEGMSERQRDDQATLFVASVMGNLANKAWLSGVSDVVGALADPERGADNFVQRLVGSLLVPNLVAGTARTLDPVQRETETIGDGLKSRIPGLRDDLLPRRDIWGNVVKSEGGIGPDFLSPMMTSKALNDPVNKALLQIDYAPSYPSRKVGGEELSPKAYDRYTEVAGKLSHSALARLVASPEWKQLDDVGKVKAAKQAVTGARRDARGQLFEGKNASDDDDVITSDISPVAGASNDDPWSAFPDVGGQRVPPPRKGAANDAWSAFPDAGGKRVPAPRSNPPRLPGNDPWSSFKDPEQRDVMGNLLKIPGITMDSFTSGYRTPEYQADMRRRGYKPADNSGHLDGSSLDIPVPRGRSMNWLVGQVKKAEPTARLLPEGDHLHATFPGWYGAPVLGGAKRAGLRNPNAKLPAPRLQNR